jgi:hypothetical protein
MARRARSPALRRGAISAVFPSTTASAITTSFTGATPYEHGLTGWFTYFAAAGCVAAPLPFRSRGDNLPLGARGIAGSHLYSESSLFDSIGVRGMVVTHRSIVNSNYNLHYCGRAERVAYADLQGFVEQTEAAVKSGPERKFIYTYWPEFDTLAHRHGVASPEVHASSNESTRRSPTWSRGLRGPIRCSSQPPTMDSSTAPGAPRSRWKMRPASRACCAFRCAASAAQRSAMSRKGAYPSSRPARATGSASAAKSVAAPRLPRKAGSAPAARTRA